jgi:RHH-type proline utilization regulon transcriptional repressor/proline dehydrogenase/delta 1-pyrroline-5-carboxylate dehydrogenase
MEESTVTNTYTLGEFRNEPLRDFSEEFHRQAVREALTQVETARLSGRLAARPIVDGQTLQGSSSFMRLDPSDSSLGIGTVYLADEALAEKAVQSCHAGLPQWRTLEASTRIAAIRRIAQLMRNQKAYLAAVMTRESGKPWKEADADVAEAIDFCDYYALHAEKLAGTRLTEKVLGEENVYFYQPRGVAAVISPWNFPLAITCGMVVAALVTGNTVVLKPAEQSSIIGAEFARLVYEAGVPGSSFAFLPGLGETVGRFLVSHPRVDMIAFTGSRGVGFEIIKTAATIVLGQRSIKKVIAELGGKNAIIVDEDADMDDSIRGILYSAFGYAGQKCSACSRLIVVGSAYEPLLKRLALATKDLIIGAASDPASFLGPVIDNESKSRINSIISEGCQSLFLLTQGSLTLEQERSGSFVNPTIFRDVPVTHPIWREEIFGPVLACTQARSFEHALSIATDSEYALTGGVFSRHPQHLALAREEYRVGNLYLNRAITGALVGRQPFGGFGFSGIGSKAGGPDYLLQFVEPRVVTENTMRRGFSPDL